jgi:hypothetical protein
VADTDYKDKDKNNMSDSPEFDPFNQPQDAEADITDAVPGDVLDGVDVDADLDDLFDGAELDLEEDETDEEVKVYEAGNTYVNPLDVGLKDKMWVPIRITTSEFKEKHTPRLSSKVCVAVKVGEDGKKRVFVGFDQVETQIAAGATEVVVEHELPYFICEANHVAPEFGQRRYPYEIEVPSLTIKTAFFKEQRSGRKGFKNDDGRTLRVAAGATQPGEKVNLKTMPEIAKRIEDKIVMACITLSTKTKTRPRLDGNNQPISVLLDTVSGAPITVFSPQDGTGYILNDGSGQVWDGNEKLLVRVDDRIYAIADRGEESGPLMEEFAQTTDYLKTKFLPVPEREVEVHLRSGDVVQGEITWGTVGAIAQNKVPGAFVDIMITSGDKVGQTITAVWLGVRWSEVASGKDASDGEASEGGGLDEFAGAKNL